MKNLKDILNESRGDIDKDIEKKIKELSREYDDGESEAKYIARDVAQEMSYWMKSYMIERACEWLKENCRDYSYDDYNNTAYIHITDLIKEFKEEMEK